MKRARRAYDVSGRQAAAQRTREQIVEAAMARLREVRPEQLSYADLASETGIAVRTVYRHFPTMDDLLGAALAAFLSRVSGDAPLTEMSLVDIGDRIETFHEALSAEPGLYRLFFTLPARSGTGFAAVIERVCREALARIPAEHHDAVCAAVELLLGPYAWETFHTHWNVPPARMTRTVLVSVQLLLDGFVANPRALSPSSARPAMFQRKRGS